MGVLGPVFSMTTTADVVYTHKKFKRAAVENWDGNEQENSKRLVSDEVVTSGTKSWPVTQEGNANSKASLPLKNGHLSSESDDDKSVETHRCDHCGLKFNKISVLQKHIITHGIEKQNSYIQFDAKLTTKNHLIKHASHFQQNNFNEDIRNENLSDAGEVFEVETEQHSKSRKESHIKKLYNGSVEFSDITIERVKAEDVLRNQYSNEANDDESSYSTATSSRQLYKPKFRVQYPFQDIDILPINPSIQNSPTHSLDSPVNSAISSKTYHGSPVPLTGTLSDLELTKNQKNSKANLPYLDIKSVKKETGASSSWSSGSHTASIWKGIKSPSPELVGQHINKLITENQAIVETHNSLWALKQRRQSSISSSSSESDGSSSGKHHRRLSLTDQHSKVGKSHSGSSYSTYSKDRSQSLTSESLLSDVRHTFSPSLPQCSYLQLAHSSTTSASASRPTISSSGPTSNQSISPGQIISSPTDTPLQENLIRHNNEAYNLSVVRDILKSRGALIDCTTITKTPTDNESKIIYTGKRSVTNLPYKDGYDAERIDLREEVNFTCSQCGTNLYSYGELENHRKYNCSQGNSDRSSSNVNQDENKASQGQDLALDLHKKPDRTKSYETPSTYRSVYQPESHQKHFDDKYHHGNSSPIIFKDDVIDVSFPPNKKRKLSSNVISLERSSSVGSPSYQVTRNASIEEIYRQNNNNKHHLFGGGEVQICDGREPKTMKIEPTKTQSFDIGGVSSFTNSSSSDKPECLVPTTVVVTIAKSGLNSGGTVQVEHQTSTTTKTVSSNHTNSLPHHHHHHHHHLSEQSSYNYPNASKTVPLPNIYDTSSKFSFHSPFTQFAPQLQLPNLAIPGVPAPDMSALSLMHSSNQFQSSSPLTGGVVQSSKSQNLGFSISLPPGTSLETKKKVNHGSSTSSNHGEDKEIPTQPAVIGFPRTILVGEEKIPYVPGIPGPYSQSGNIDVISNILPHNIVPPNDKGFLSAKESELKKGALPIVSISSTLKPSLNITPVKDRNLLLKTHSLDKPLDYCTDLSNTVQVSGLSNKEKQCKSSARGNQASVINLALPSCSKDDNNTVSQGKSIDKSNTASVIQIDCKNLSSITRPSSLDYLPTINIASKTPEPRTPVSSESSENSSHKLKGTKREINSKDDENFLMPRKRPNTLAIKPQSFIPKSSLALIGSTLVSPDTPRPKKSCAQLLLNGSAYTYLGLKVTTRCFYCCIYRPQPMYVPQSTDPKLSMYSNWQLRKPATDNPFNLAPAQAMGLYISNTFTNSSYTIAKPKEVESITTHSSYWTYKDHKEVENTNTKNVITSESNISLSTRSETSEIKPDSNGSSKSSTPTPLKDSRDNSDLIEGTSTKRIKIFEGGFKTNEDYTYVRGRGRGRYVCGACGIRCKKPSMLKKHIRTHTDLRPYSCSHCNFRLVISILIYLSIK